MPYADVDPIVNAVLYEGYLLYPYRPSTKNRSRWTFGGVFPRGFCEHAGQGEHCVTRAACLVRASHDTVIDVEARFLQTIERRIARVGRDAFADTHLAPDAGAGMRCGGLPEPPTGFEFVAGLEVNGTRYESWQESIERRIKLPPSRIDELLSAPRRLCFDFAPDETIERIPGEMIECAGLVVRQRAHIAGTVEASAECLEAPSAERAGLFRLTVRIANDSPLDAIVGADALEPAEWTRAGEPSRAATLSRSLASAHAVLRVDRGEFLSAIDEATGDEGSRDPAGGNQAGSAATRARAVGATGSGAAGDRPTGVLWPVLVGTPGDRHTMLCSPIILYDYPQIAPESPGDLFDATEIDEILTLRILTLTDDEERQVRALDERGRALLERTQNLAHRQLAGLHGSMQRLQRKETHSND